MKVYPEKLGAELKHRIAPVYIVSGDEPLLVQEACDEIRGALRQRGFSERELFHVEPGFDWDEVLFSANSMSLFAEQKILEIRMPGGKPGDNGARALKVYTEALPDGTVMLLVLPRVDQSTQRTKWFKALESAGVLVQVWPIDLKRMPRWLDDRFRKAGLTASHDAIDALIDRIEGNLLAAVQEIERLRLACGTDRIELEHVQDGVADSSRYDVFSLIDAAVAQDAVRTLKVLQGLRSEGADVLFLVSMLARELRSLSAMAFLVERGQSVNQAVQSGRVWQKRKVLVSRCLGSHRAGELAGLESRLSRIDQMAKGIGSGDPWMEVTDVLLALAGRPAIDELRIHR